MYASPLLSQRVVHSIPVHVPCMVYGNVPFTELHEHAYVFCCRTNVYRLPTIYGNLHLLAQPNFMHVSLSISE